MRWSLGPLVVFTLLVAGCQRVNYDRTVQLDAGEARTLNVDAPRSDQKVSVAVSSSSCPVNVYVILEKDRKSAVEALDKDQPPPGALAGKEKTQDATLEATVPANNAYAVVVAGATRKTDVKVKITGR